LIPRNVLGWFPNEEPRGRRTPWKPTLILFKPEEEDPPQKQPQFFQQNWGCFSGGSLVEGEKENGQNKQNFKGIYPSNGISREKKIDKK